MICLLGPSYREMHLGKYTFSDHSCRIDQVPSINSKKEKNLTSYSVDYVPC